MIGRPGGAVPTFARSGKSGTRKVSPERPPVAAIGFVEGVNRYLSAIASAFSAAGRGRDPGHSEEVGLPAQETFWRAGRRVIGLPREQPNPGRGAAPGQHVSHPYGPKRPGGELN